MLYVMSPELTHLITLSVCPLIYVSSLPSSLSPWQLPLYSLFL